MNKSEQLSKLWPEYFSEPNDKIMEEKLKVILKNLKMINEKF